MKRFKKERRMQYQKNADSIEMIRASPPVNNALDGWQRMQICQNLWSHQNVNSIWAMSNSPWLLRLGGRINKTREVGAGLTESGRHLLAAVLLPYSSLLDRLTIDDHLGT